MGGMIGLFMYATRNATATCQSNCSAWRRGQILGQVMATRLRHLALRLVAKLGRKSHE